MDSIGTYWIAMYINEIFESSGVECIPKEIIKFINNKNITTSIYRILANFSIMCRYFCINFIDLKFKFKRLVDYTNLFFSDEYERAITSY